MADPVRDDNLRLVLAEQEKSFIADRLGYHRRSLLGLLAAAAAIAAVLLALYVMPQSKIFMVIAILAFGAGLFFIVALVLTVGDGKAPSCVEVVGTPMIRKQSPQG
jgi:hypothetical protein